MKIYCVRTDNGYGYWHYGNRVVAPGISTAWCDLYAEIKAYGVV
ncbi:hypothetical protein ACWCXX_06325 [Streptomyces sp. NPDC001732]